MKIMILILAMMAVTYIPRAIPAILVEKMRFGEKTEMFLSLIPYTAMTALIFPGVLSMDGDRMWIGMIGAMTAVLLSWRRVPIMLVIGGSIAVVMAAYLII